MKTVTIADGELVRGFQTADLGGHGVVTGTARVLTEDELDRFHDDEFPRLVRQHRSKPRAWAELYARCVLTWDVKTAAGADAPVTPDSFMKLPTPVRKQFGDIVTGYAADPFSEPPGGSTGSS